VRQRTERPEREAYIDQHDRRGSICEGFNMMKFIAVTFVTVLAVGSIFGCVIGEGYRGDSMHGDRVERDGMRENRMDRQGEDQRDRSERDERRGTDDQRRENR